MKRLLSTGFLLTAIIAAPLSAQSAEGVSFSIPLPTKQSDQYSDSLPADERARANIDALAECIIKRDRKKAFDAIALGPTIEFQAAQKRLLTSTCRPREGAPYEWWAFYGSMLRAKLIDSYSGRTFAPGKEVPATKDNRPAIIVVVNEDGGRTSSQSPDHVVDSPETGSLSEYAECVVRADFKAASEFVIEPAGSTVENDAFNRLSLVTGGCSQGGHPPAMTKSVLVQILAEALEAKIATAREVRPNA